VLRQPWISLECNSKSLDLRFKHFFFYQLFSHPANGALPFPHRESTATWSFEFLSPFLPVPGPGVCHISQMGGSHSQIQMWLSCPVLYFTLPNTNTNDPFAPSIRDVQPHVAVPLFTAFPVSYIGILKLIPTQLLHRCGRSLFIIPFPARTTVT
jgi:hypothetical protein